MLTGQQLIYPQMKKILLDKNKNNNTDNKQFKIQNYTIGLTDKALIVTKQEKYCMTVGKIVIVAQFHQPVKANFVSSFILRVINF